MESLAGQATRSGPKGDGSLRLRVSRIGEGLLI